MEFYNLQEDEVVLYKQNVYSVDNKHASQLILTNLNVVIITKSNDRSLAEILPVNHIKIYKEKPQILPNGNLVEIYFLEKEISIEFYSKSELRKFITISTDLLTNTTKSERNAKKVKDVIKLVDDTLGIDSVHATSDALKNGVIGQTSKILGQGIKSITKFIKKK